MVRGWGEALIAGCMFGLQVDRPINGGRKKGII